MRALIDPFLLMNCGFDQWFPDPVALMMNCIFNCGTKISPSLLKLPLSECFIIATGKKMKSIPLNFCSSCLFLLSARIPGAYHQAQSYAVVGTEPKALYKPGRLTIKWTQNSSPKFWPHYGSSLRNNTGTLRQGPYDREWNDEVCGNSHAHGMIEVSQAITQAAHKV